VEQVLNEAPAGSDTVIVSHGAVGTLYKCHLKGIPISRSEDQPRQGNVYRWTRRPAACCTTGKHCRTSERATTTRLEGI
jgi:hypothetical protein